MTTTDYSDFRVLIDDAAAAPEPGFSENASALGDIIKNSTPEFAVGIFGSWGGKTTLMRQIERLLDQDQAIVTACVSRWTGRQSWSRCRGRRGGRPAAQGGVGVPGSVGRSSPPPRQSFASCDASPTWGRTPEPMPAPASKRSGSVLIAS